MRTTGATEEQVNAAYEVALHYVKGIDFDDDRAETIDRWIKDIGDVFCAALVPPTHRVVSAYDLRKLKQLHDELAEMTFLAPSMDAVAFLARIDEVIGS